MISEKNAPRLLGAMFLIVIVTSARRRAECGDRDRRHFGCSCRNIQQASTDAVERTGQPGQQPRHRRPGGPALYRPQAAEQDPRPCRPGLVDERLLLRLPHRQIVFASTMPSSSTINGTRWIIVVSAPVRLRPTAPLTSPRAHAERRSGRRSKLSFALITRRTRGWASSRLRRCGRPAGRREEARAVPHVPLLLFQLHQVLHHGFGIVRFDLPRDVVLRVLDRFDQNVC